MGWPLQIEQRSFIKYLLAEKCKPCEIYRNLSVCDYNSEWNRQSMERKHTDTLVKRKVLGIAVSKEGHADCLLEYEWNHHS